MRTKGRALGPMRNICEMFDDVSKIEQDPKMMGRRATMLLAPDKGRKESTDPKREKDAAEQAGKR